MLEFYPLTEDRWADFERLFGERGACAGCWCMWWRLTRAEFGRGRGEGNKQAMRAVVESGRAPGILAYADGEPVGWCSVAPREDFPALERSDVLKRLDDIPVWSVVCFFVDKRYRRKGLTLELLRAAIEYVRERGGKVLEGYPVEATSERMPTVSVYTGLASAFKKVGFVECACRSEKRPVMRFYI